MLEALKNSRYIQLSLGLNVLMLITSILSVAFFSLFTKETWDVFLIVGIAIIVLFFVSIAASLVYLFIGKVPFNRRLIPLIGNLSMFFLFPLVQQIVPSSRDNGYQFNTTPQSLSYTCEDGKHFPLTFVDESKIIVEADQTSYSFELEQEAKDGEIRTYANEEYAFTFVSTYEHDQFILTTRNESEPRSTICHISNP